MGENPVALRTLGLILIQTSGEGVSAERAAGIHALRQAERRGDVDAGLLLGRILVGEGKQSSRREARTLFRRAMDRGSTEGEYLYGKLLLDSTNERDRRSGVAVLEGLVAMRGHALAALHLGLHLARIKADMKKAEHYLSYALEQDLHHHQDVVGYSKVNEPGAIEEGWRVLRAMRAGRAQADRR